MMPKKFQFQVCGTNNTFIVIALQAFILPYVSGSPVVDKNNVDEPVKTGDISRGMLFPNRQTFPL
jgi:hypothetical protein